MKAIRYYRYGGPEDLRLEDIEPPKPDPDRVLVRVKAASVNPYDWHFMRGKPLLVRFFAGLFKPKNNGLGADFSGVVEAVGANVTQVNPGDEIFGESQGAFAEFVTAAAKSIALKPANLSFDEAAGVPMAGFTALQALRDIGELQSGQTVLINGASGGVGIFAVQIAKSMGGEVTGVCSSRNADMVRSLGADHMIDYTKENFTEGSKHYDIILDNIGNHSLSTCRRVLTPHGRFLLVGADYGGGGYLGSMIKMPLMSRKKGKKLLGVMAANRQSDLLKLKEMAESGAIRPVIDKRFPLAETPAALAYVETGHARGKVVISI